MALKNILENTFSLLADQNPFNEAAENVGKLVTQTTMAKTSTMVTSDKAINGFISINIPLDDVLTNVEGSVPLQQVGNIAIAEMTKEVPGIKDKLVQQVGSAEATLIESVIGKAPSNGFLEDIVVSGTPEGLTFGVKLAVPDVEANKVIEIAKGAVDLTVSLTDELKGTIDDFEAYAEQALNESLNGVISDLLGSKTGKVLTSLNAINSIINKPQDFLNNVIDAGFNSVIENTNENVFKTASTTMNSLAFKNGIQVNIQADDRKTIIQNISAGKFEKAAQIMKKYSDEDIGTIRTNLSVIDNRAVSKVKAEAAPVDIEAVDIDKISQQWSGVNTPLSYFENNFIANDAQLLSEFKNVDREVTQIVVGSTNTLKEYNWTAQKLHEALAGGESLGIDYYNNTQQNSFLKYHYVIEQNGRISRAVPIDREIKTSEARFIAPHNKYTVFVLLVGGVDHNTSYKIDDISGFYSGEGYYQPQINALKSIFKAAYASYPGMQALGISEVSDFPGPHFSVEDFVEAHYGKKSLYSDPSTQPPFSRKDIAQNTNRAL
jgi:hypothetical protein